MRLASLGGAKGAWLDQTADLLVAAILERDDFREGAQDPRRVLTLAHAADVAHARQAGATMAQLHERFGYSRQHLYRLLHLHGESVTRHQATVSGFNGSSHSLEHR